MDTTDSAFRRWTTMMTAGRIFMWLATVRRAFCITTTMMERLRMWRWWRERRSTRTEKNRRGWARQWATITGMDGWTFSRRIFRTIPRRFTGITGTERLMM